MADENLERLIVSIEGDFSNLLRASEDGVRAASTELEKLDKTGAKTGQSLKGAAGLAGAAFGLAAGAAGKLLDVVIRLGSAIPNMVGRLASESVAINSQCTLLGQYDVPNYYSEFRAVFTKKPIVTPYRGAGRQHGVFVMERLLDLAARELGIDRVEIRRRNLIPPEKFPYNNEIIYQDFAPLVYDSGTYAPALDKAVDLIGYRQVKITPEMVGRTVAVFTSVEVKTDRGRPSEAQVRWLEHLQSAGAIAIIACASSSPGATASMKRVTLSPDRCTTIAPTITPRPIPPHTPSPPFHTAKTPHHSSGTSFHDVMTW